MCSIFKKQFKLLKKCLANQELDTVARKLLMSVFDAMQCFQNVINAIYNNPTGHEKPTTLN